MVNIIFLILECRSWQINVGTTAPKAGGAIHSDFDNFFIKADVTKYDEFVKNYPKKTMKTTSEGKTYIVQDADIMVFKHRKN
jgi:ribosome-binding ATPase